VAVISADGKGIVKCLDALRPAMTKAAHLDVHKLKSRISKGEERNSKRMGELAVVYDATLVPHPGRRLRPQRRREEGTGTGGDGEVAQPLSAARMVRLARFGSDGVGPPAESVQPRTAASRCNLRSVVVHVDGVSPRRGVRQAL